MKTFLMVSMGGVAAVAMVSSCSSSSGANDGSAALCSPSAHEAEPPRRQVDVTGGVPFDQFPNALAVARCDYVRRCYGLATYVANDCADTVVASGTFTYQTCTPDGTNARCHRSSIFYNIGLFDQLVGKVVAGEARFDPARAGECIAALLAEPCVSRDLIESLPACVGVISCLAEPGAGSPGGGATDAGLSCATLAEEQGPFPTCTTADQCAGVAANPPLPYCVSGLCAPSPCGFQPTCTGVAQAGQPCDATAPSIVSGATPASAAVFCAPGLICQGTDVDAGTMGTCIVPKDVGGPCTVTSDCMPGLACASGTCAIPPCSGPCADSLCRVDVAYCDFASGQCMPVRKLNDSCGDAINSCGPGVVCQPPTGICLPPTL